MISEDNFVKSNTYRNIRDYLLSDENFRLALGNDELILNEVGMHVLDKIKRSVFWEKFESRLLDKAKKQTTDELENFKVRQRKLIKKYENALKNNLSTNSKDELQKIEEDAIKKVKALFKKEVFL